MFAGTRAANAESVVTVGTAPTGLGVAALAEGEADGEVEGGELQPANATTASTPRTGTSLREISTR